MVRTVFLAGCALLAGSGAALSEVTLHTLDGRKLEAVTLELVPDGGLRINVGGQVETLAAGVTLFAEIRSPVALTLPDEDALVLLRDGSELAGKLGEDREDQLQLETAALGRVLLPIDLIRAVSFGAAGQRIDPSTLRATGEQDLLFRRGPVEGDELRGTLVGIGLSGVQIDCELGEITVDLEKVLGVAVAELDKQQVPARQRVELELRGGGLLIGSLLDLTTGRIKVRTSFDEELVIPLERLSRIRFPSDRFVYLSDLDPASVAQTPFIGGDDEFLFPWRRDRSVTGRPLSISGQRFGKGLGLHSRSRLSYDLSGEFQRFEAQIGISDEVAGLGVPGSVLFRIFVDGEPRFESPVIRSGEPPRSVVVQGLAGAQQLSVEVDFADRGDVADRAVLGNPILYRK